MPAELTYPGVYIEEIPSGVRTIVGVSTSIAAFVGRTPRGPTDRPVLITSFADYERTFGGTADSAGGGLDQKYPISYSVLDFYNNGGSLAIICRTEKGSKTAKFEAHGLKLQASSSGAWANKLRIRITKPDPNADSTKAIALSLGVAANELFHLAVKDTRTGGDTEIFVNLTAKPSVRHVTGILAQSNFVRTDGVPAFPGGVHPGAEPADFSVPANSDGVSAAPNDGADSADLAALADFGDRTKPTGLYLLDKADLFNLLVIPPDKLGQNVPKELHAPAAAYCREKRALYIVDPPTGWTTMAQAKAGATGTTDINIKGPDARHAALYFPLMFRGGPSVDAFTASGAIAGIMARTDVTRGVWKAPAGIEASLVGATGLSLLLNDLENGQLNQIGVNCLRTFPIYGNIVWGARTVAGADVIADEYKYVPVRRVANFIEESLFRGLKWVVFEPNDEPLWGQIRLNVGAFMQDLFRQGAFQGTSARDAYFVRCDKTTTTQNDINKGVVNIVVGFAPLKPAEFVVLKLTQIAGQIQT